MPKPTFENIAPQKQTRVLAALIAEFSAYPLADAQVARIVQTADIARGAFYKYFDDLEDAYRYAFSAVTAQIHADFRPNDHHGYGEAVRQFLTSIKASPYFDFMRMYYTKNVGRIAIERTPNETDPTLWAVSTLSHAAIAQVMQAPEQETQVLHNLSVSLKRLNPNE